MSQSDQAVEAAVTSLSMLGSEVASFTFAPSSTSTQERTYSLSPPPGTAAATIALQGFDLQYTDKNHFDFGALQVALRTTITESRCVVTLRDDNVNKRQWSGTVSGIATFFGNSR